MTKSVDRRAVPNDERGPGDRPGDRPDGRSSRSQRTRLAVIDALLGLITEGHASPSAQQVAERAEVSTRTVFAHFASLEDLHCASVEQATVRVLSLLSPIDRDQPLSGRLDELCAQRARVNEEIGPISRAAARRAPSSAPLAQAIERGRRASREQLDRLFAVELARLDGPTRRRRRASLDALLGPEAWDLLRSAHGLSPDQARLAVREAVHTLLTQGAPEVEPAAAAGSARSTAAAGHLGTGRAGGTDQAIGEIDERIERLVAAIESGAPAELVAPRLQALTEARSALQG